MGPSKVLLHLRHSNKQFTEVLSCYPPNNSEASQATEIFRAVNQQWRAFCSIPEESSKAKKSRRSRSRLASRPVWDNGKRGRSSQANSSRSHTKDSETSGDDDFRWETSFGNLIWSCNNTNGSCLV